ncbi:MAG: cobalt/nickel transport system ATP-binding protein [Eubacteriales bacterium]|nr:cobalt/nickel transport system ATP-binding protein [Eubacteriales bacterium]
MAIIELVGVHYTYEDGTTALRGVDLKVERKEKLALIGPNGSGKTTLLLHFNGILKPTHGRVLLEGREIKYSRRELKELRRTVGVVFQDPDTQLFAATVYQDVSFGPLNLDLPEDEVRKRVEEALRLTGALPFQDRSPQYLSYGQKKRVAIAGILAMEPQVVVCDEPTAWLDRDGCQQVMELLDRAAAAGVTVVISTHDVDLAYAWADRVVVMKDGTVIAQGDPVEIFMQDDLLRQAGLHRPWVLDMWLTLRKKGLVDRSATVPRTGEELKACLES